MIWIEVVRRLKEEMFYEKRTEKTKDSPESNAYFNLRSFNIVKENVLRLIGGRKGLNILDVGCGTGHLTCPLAKDNYLVGVDLSLEILNFAKNKGFSTIQASGCNLPIKDNRFDLVISTNVIQLVAEGEEFVKELVRVAKSEARIIITTLNDWSIIFKVLRIIRRNFFRNFHFYSLNDLKGMTTNVETILFLYFPLRKVRIIKGNSKINLLDKYLPTTFIMEAKKVSI